jgi:hypothetical protein
MQVLIHNRHGGSMGQPLPSARLGPFVLSLRQDGETSAESTKGEISDRGESTSNISRVANASNSEIAIIETSGK